MIQPYFKYVKYVVSGGTAAFVNIGSLYLLTEYGHIYYLASAVLAFVLSFMVSFLLQKFWTFQDRARTGMHKQIFWYFIISLGNLTCNTLLIYVLVAYAHLWYIAAAFFAGLLIAFASFFIYRHFIFKVVI